MCVIPPVRDSCELVGTGRVCRDGACPTNSNKIETPPRREGFCAPTDLAIGINSLAPIPLASVRL
jgi:hypothetical protein